LETNGPEKKKKEKKKKGKKISALREMTKHILSAICWPFRETLPRAS
jgi:preprotein translocase subunit SecE